MHPIALYGKKMFQTESSSGYKWKLNITIDVPLAAFNSLYTLHATHTHRQNSFDSAGRVYYTPVDWYTAISFLETNGNERTDKTEKYNNKKTTKLKYTQLISRSGWYEMNQAFFERFLSIFFRLLLLLHSECYRKKNDTISSILKSFW